MYYPITEIIIHKHNNTGTNWFLFLNILHAKEFTLINIIHYQTNPERILNFVKLITRCLKTDKDSRKNSTKGYNPSEKGVRGKSVRGKNVRVKS